MGAEGGRQSQWRNRLPDKRRPHWGLPRKDGGHTKRFLDTLNTPMAALVTLIVVVAANSFLYFGYYAPAVTPPPTTKATPLADEGTGPSTVAEPTGVQEEGGQGLRETSGETVPSRGAATTASPSTSPGASPSASSSASASPSLP
ncbi:MAG: hypothetical protein AVDCRST_MAG01-01-1107 [uncultured Rubrobacteraceae bacterium]|uniref:Uncharacterized protein n=1 Tax=uncultured Rubrobacteraceae bacterium TaxID=349277 RepID=A0A6J4P1B0_9ACTN|nr:MAG: hypothetical protein AVDCRST_MAG01-01-1107 [uncultured Rubrobacteraceae bacterium]